jgi:uncharacterized damage-inducible protein DinB
MRFAYISVVFIFAVWLVDLSAAPAYADATRHLNEAFAELDASDAEWRQNDAEFRKLREKNKTSNGEIEEFASFVAELRRKMLENCQAYRQLGGDPESLGFDCILPKEIPVAWQELPQSPKTLQTEQEKMDALDSALSESLSEFDKELQEKQITLRDQPGNPSSGGYASNQGETGGGGIRSDSASVETNPGGYQGISSGTGTVLHPTEPGAGPGVQKQAKGQIPQSKTKSGASDGNDDDVVARQLREAAEGESDPILRQKLWDEYRKYTASIK